MRRFWIVLVTVLIVAAGVSAPRALTVSASGHGFVATTNKKHLPSFDLQVDAYLKRAHFSGSVLVARQGKLLVSRGYGMANRKRGTANLVQTQFRLGHATEQFTAMATLLAQDQGRLLVSNPICKYLPNCPKAWKQITIRELMNRTSGIHDDGTAYLTATTPAQFISLAQHQPLDFPSGTQFGFSDTPAIILSVIVAKVSGEPYTTFVQQNILNRLHMSSTGFDLDRRALPHRAIGYVSGGRPDSVIKLAFPNASYGMYSTVEDLYRWDEALGRGALSQKAWTAMFTPYKDITSLFPFPHSFSSVGVGYGWFIAKDAGHRLVFLDDDHLPGFQIYNGRYLDNKVSVIVLSNIHSDPPSVKDIGTALAAMVFARQ